MSAESPRAIRSGKRQRIDWRHAAELIARGRSLAAVAAQVGCSRNYLARKLRRDAEFQSWVAECARPAGEGEAQGHRLLRLRRTVYDAIENEVRAGNVRVILWLADRLKLINPPDERTPEQELQAMLGGLSQDELEEFESLKDRD